MSELKKRENLGQVLEDALSIYFSDENEICKVRWIEKPALLNKLLISDDNFWLCNIYTNAIFTISCKSHVCVPLKLEFSKSLIWWKTVFQGIYVYLSFARGFSRLMAQHVLEVKPAIKDASERIIIPGNHKVRMLDYAGNKCISIMKTGYPEKMFQQEIKYRKIAYKNNVPVVNILDVEPDKKIIKEELIVGTPLNRMPNSELLVYLDKAIKAISELMNRTSVQIDADKYVGKMQASAAEMLQACLCMDETYKKKVMDVFLLVKNKLLFRSGDKINVCVSHGDFQDGNILCADNTIRLIDWEYADLRQYGFDYMVYFQKTRQPVLLAERFKQFTAGRMPDILKNIFLKKESQEHNTVNLNNVLYLFILEELLIRINENSFSFIKQPDSGIKLYMDEVVLFLNGNVL